LPRDAVDRYHTEVSEEILLNQPGMELLRKRLLKLAGDFYEKFTKDRADDVSVRADYGKALFRLAQITGDVGDEPKAIKLHEQAAKLFTELFAKDANPETQARLAECYHHLGRLYRKEEDAKKSETDYKNALEIWEKLTAKAGARDEYVEGLARTLNGLGNLYQKARKLEEAQKYYKEAMSGWKTLLDAHKDVAKYQREYATAAANLGKLVDARDIQKKTGRRLSHRRPLQG